MARRPPPATLVMTTTALVQGRPVTEYLGVIAAQQLIGASAVRDLLTGFRDLLSGRASSYERTLQTAREAVLQGLEDQAAARGADAVIGIALAFQSLGAQGALLMVSASGTAVRFSSEPASMAIRQV